MSVFDDPKKELEKLQQQLLEDEAWFEKELDSALRMIGEDVPKKNPTGTRAGTPAKKPAPQAPARPKPSSKTRPATDEPRKAPKEKGIRGLVILAVLETLGIVGVVAYWLLVILK